MYLLWPLCTCKRNTYRYRGYLTSDLGICTSDLAGEAWGDWSLYTDSPLRAFEGELGVQALSGEVEIHGPILDDVPFWNGVPFRSWLVYLLNKRPCGF